MPLSTDGTLVPIGIVAAQRLPVIVQRVQHYPWGDQLDLAAPEQLGPCLQVYALLSDGQAACHHLCCPLPGLVLTIRA